MKRNYRFPANGRARWILALLLTQFHPSSSTSLAYGQPAPTFHVGCGELRDAIALHGIDGSELTTIRVEGKITAIDDTGSVVFVLLCELPDPRVLCVTYGTNGNQVGDQVVVGGGFGRQDPDHIMLDPCLHGSPEQYRE